MGRNKPFLAQKLFCFELDKNRRLSICTKVVQSVAGADQVCSIIIYTEINLQPIKPTRQTLWFWALPQFDYRKLLWSHWAVRLMTFAKVKNWPSNIPVGGIGYSAERMQKSPCWLLVIWRCLKFSRKSPMHSKLIFHLAAGPKPHVNKWHHK